MLKKFVLVSLLVVSSAAVCMEPITVDPFTAQEIALWDASWLIRQLDPKVEKQDATDIVQDLNLDDAWKNLEGESVYQRLLVSPQSVKNQLYKQFNDEFAQRTFITSCEQPLGSDWPGLKMAFVLFLLMNADIDGEIYEEDRNAHRKGFMLECSLWQDDHAFAQFLLQHGATSNYPTVLQPHYRKARSAKMAQLLLEHGADYSMQPKDTGYTLLHTACERHNKADLVPFYLDQGFQVNANELISEGTPLMVLARGALFKPIERVQAKLVALLSAGADISIRNGLGGTVIDIARIHNRYGKTEDGYYPESVKLFIKMIEEAQSKSAESSGH